MERCTKFHLSLAILYFHMCSQVTLFFSFCLFSFFFFPLLALHKVLWLMGIHWYALPRWLPFQLAKGCRLICSFPAGAHVYWDRRNDAFVLQWVKTCSVYLDNGNVRFDKWYLTSVSLNFFSVALKKLIKWKVAWMDKQTWKQGLLGNDLNGIYMYAGIISESMLDLWTCFAHWISMLWEN